MKWDLDRTDFEILSLLRRDGRMPVREIADAVNRAPSTVYDRISALKESGALRGIHAEVEERAVGVGLQALVAVRLQEHSRDLVEDFRAHALSRSPVVSLYHVGGDHDFLIHVAVHDVDQLRDFVLDEFTTRGEIEQVETWIVFEYTPTWELPDVAGDE
jgi:DNA-binding Lrp family transcriptional regulator